MPVQTVNHNDKAKTSAPNPKIRENNSKDRPSDQNADDVQTNYGFGQGADMDTSAEETERQEYTADGLPRTQGYSVDKVGRSHDDVAPEKTERKNRSDCGC